MGYWHGVIDLDTGSGPGTFDQIVVEKWIDLDLTPPLFALNPLPSTGGGLNALDMKARLQGKNKCR